MAAKLDKEVVSELVNLLMLPWGSVKLECDGYTVDLQVYRVKNSMTYRVMTYVNGEFRWEWVIPKADTPLRPETKFLRKSVTKNISPAKRLKLEKVYGKRFIAKDPFCNGSTTSYMPDWPTGRAVLSHFMKVCDSIKVVKADPFADRDKSLTVITNGADSTNANTSF